LEYNNNNNSLSQNIPLFLALKALYIWKGESPQPPGWCDGCHSAP